MNRMQDKFDAGLRASFEAASKERDNVELIKEMSRKQRKELAAGIAATIPHQMEHWREQAARKWGIDIAYPDELKQFRMDEPHSVIGATSLLMRANHYLVFEECLQKLDIYAADASLSEGELAIKVCEIGIEALNAYKGVLIHMHQELTVLASKYGTEEAIQFAREALARQLSGHLATQISMKNGRLRAALDEIREHKKQAKRERLEVLLRELYILAPEVWAEHHSTDWRLFTTRSAVVKQIEKRLKTEAMPATEEDELGAFAARERLLKLGRDAGLPPREYELRKLLAENPDMPYREAAKSLGVAVGTVGALKARIKKTLKLRSTFPA
jgi:DNA-binding CsgD family transcriptional regulator